MKRPKVEWDDSFYVEIYQMLREGRTKDEVASRLGVTTKRLDFWIASKPALKEAITRATAPKENGYSGFKDYVHGRLPEEARRYWDELDSVDKGKDEVGREDILDRLTRSPTKTQQHLFLYALLHCNFMKTMACRKVGIPLKTLTGWMKDPAFRQIVMGMHEHKQDFYESALINLVKQGDSAATIFANKTINRPRGYNDKVTVEISQTITSRNEITVEDLDQDTLRALLEAKRRKALAIEDKTDVRDAEVIE